MSELLYELLFISAPQTIGAIATYAANFGQGTGPVSVYGMQCSGSESRLLDCTYSPYSSTYHGRDAGVRCAGGNAMIGECSC